MEYRQLGRTGVRVSALCLGTMLFGGKTDEQEAFKIVDAALDAGINFVDTANVYVGGHSEETVGKALKSPGRREKIVLATKVNVRVGEDPNAAGNHRRHIVEQCNQSLRRLQTDYIDLYYIHRPAQNIPIDETLRALDDLIHAGKVLYIGTSTFAAWSILESLWVSKEYHLNRFVCEQPPYHLLDRSIERELIPMAQTYGTALIPWSPLAGGLLTGKYRRDAIPGDGRIQSGNTWGDKHLSDAAFNAIEALDRLAKEKGITLSQLALAWCLSKPGITSPILGARTLEQLQEQLGALNVALTAEDHACIDEIAPSGNSIVPYYYADQYADFRPAQYRW